MIVVAVYNLKGGVGKSTTAINLAYLAAASGARTLLWDLDAQAASSFAFRVNPEVEGFGKKSLRQIDTLTEAIKATDYDNLDLLPADFAYRNLDRFLERSDRELAEVLQKLGRGYSHVLLDCPPGLSTLSENVFDAADLVLVPTIPTVLSLRTLSRLIEHFGHRGEATKVTPFLSMVDRRKALHRDISEWAVQYPDFFLSAQVPYASIVEQVSVLRMPLAVVARQDDATTAFDTLWSNVGARLAEPAAETTEDRRRPSAFAKAIADLITKLGGEDDAAEDKHPLVAESETPRKTDVEACSHRIRLQVHEEAFHSLAIELSAHATPPGTTRLSHIFDTDEGVLQRDGYLLQMLEEPRRFAVTLEMECGPAEPVSLVSPTSPISPISPISQRRDVHVAVIDGRWAADILEGSLSPVTVLKRRLGSPLPPAVSAADALTGKRPLRRVSWRKRLRRRLGPVNVPYQEGMVTLVFDFDQITSPGNKVDYEIEATATGPNAHQSERAVQQVLSNAGISWQPLTIRHSPPAPTTRAAMMPG